MRRTKIVATLGPATDSGHALEDLVRAGVDVVRVNFSHGDPDSHRTRVRRIREAADRVGRCVGVLGDLQGPKIRIARFRGGEVELAEGDAFALDASLSGDAGDRTQVGLTYPDLPKDVRAGDVLLLDDGRLVLNVDSVSGPRIETTVVVGGTLSNNKGINRQGGGLSAPAITEKDREDIRLAAELEVDFLAVSFPRSADDVHLARSLLRDAGGDASVCSKIERAEALDALDEIISASDVIMIARGDLGVEIGDAELPAVQKNLISRARKLNRVVITATQMMESMIQSPIPTRAEVFDVANAVLDGTDAVMLSGETATGRYPDKVVASMGRICAAAERQRAARRSTHRMDSYFGRVDEAIAMATMYTANHFDVAAIAALTESGATPLWMSRISSGIPIFALTQHHKTSRRLTLYRGVYPVQLDAIPETHEETNREAIRLLLEEGVVKDGELVIITKGDLNGVPGGTNAMKIVRVGETVAVP
ncbi:Pyruvate kinase [Thioalkalivibrio nitratireducens DSM 14787]|uniref:Pyruvate kinase n=1 Tax=Thioalkalivibrio nitratireducens (strain DSM 14787 / UNIQEM 213 / ALEN2) TaxID=1255043 RepID=L0DUM4_THIND|nr:pyruvate kinase [Thioalkalivibrio nitratireducens]AGA32051.1 Pyruvate kinase [Thioalkalivibrio nitratireducens DSM 14787]